MQRGVSRHSRMATPTVAAEDGVAAAESLVVSPVEVGANARHRTRRRTTIHIADNEENHEVYTELSELFHERSGRDGGLFWKETARWMKYEQEFDEGSSQWGHPHVSALEVHNLRVVQKAMEEGLYMLDMPAVSSFAEVVQCALDEAVRTHQLALSSAVMLQKTPPSPMHSVLSPWSSVVISHIPIPVVLGVFLYLAYISLYGVQLVHRLKLLFIPSKYHRHMPFTKSIRLWKLNVYTTTQLVLVAALWVVKFTPVAMFYPMLVILLIPIHKFIKQFIFTETEVQLLDKEDSHIADDIDGDEYDNRHVPY